MQRRGFLKALAALPFVAAVIPKLAKKAEPDASPVMSDPVTMNGIYDCTTRETVMTGVSNGVEWSITYFDPTV